MHQKKYFCMQCIWWGGGQHCLATPFQLNIVPLDFSNTSLQSAKNFFCKSHTKSFLTNTNKIISCYFKANSCDCSKENYIIWSDFLNISRRDLSNNYYKNVLLFFCIRHHRQMLFSVNYYIIKEIFSKIFLSTNKGHPW